MSSFEKMLGYHCGLAMVGIKAANLVCCKHKDYQNIYEEIAKLRKNLSTADIVLKVLHDNGSRILLFVYKKAVLQQQLSHKDAKELLKEFGYPQTSDIDILLGYLSERIGDSCTFPHEIGVFLGYPINDVKGFIISPHNCKLSGPWKVYDDVEGAVRTFERYKKCSAAIIRRIERGDDLKKIFA